VPHTHDLRFIILCHRGDLQAIGNRIAFDHQTVITRRLKITDWFV
jgi:hypothetical protein